MKHRCGNKKLSKPTDQRLALIKNLVVSLFENSSIKTTYTRAKEAQKYAEKLLTIAKIDSVHSRRLVMKRIDNKVTLKQIFDLKSNTFSKKESGYTRTIRCGLRKGDAAEMSLLEFVQ